MKIAVIADIHGNSAALEAVFKDIDRAGVDTIVNLGDHFSGPLDAKGTAEQLLSRQITSIRGNHDRWMIEQPPEEQYPSDQVALSQLTAPHIKWLSGLKPTAVVAGEVFLCHGTPHNDIEYWLEKVDNDGRVLMADQQQIEHYASGTQFPVILCGHTHIPRMVRLADRRLLVNPGSVGCPAYDDTEPVYHMMQTGSPDALYAIIEKKQGQWSAVLRAVPYDSTEMVRLAVSHGRQGWASAVATGWLSH